MSIKWVFNPPRGVKASLWILHAFLLMFPCRLQWSVTVLNAQFLPLMCVCECVTSESMKACKRLLSVCVCVASHLIIALLSPFDLWPFSVSLCWYRRCLKTGGARGSQAVAHRVGVGVAMGGPRLARKVKIELL